MRLWRPKPHSSTHLALPSLRAIPWHPERSGWSPWPSLSTFSGTPGDAFTPATLALERVVSAPFATHQPTCTSPLARNRILDR